jgi:diguanylate cyclase (GGDEF)-like protein
MTRPEHSDAPSAVEHQREKVAQEALDADQTAANQDQTQSDADQTSTDGDQTTADVEQALANRDQRASDRDQAAADWEQSHGGDGAAADQAHDISRKERAASTLERESTQGERTRTTAQRLASAARRDGVARVRDQTAAIRDRTAQARDDAADARDRAAEARERRARDEGFGDDLSTPSQQARTLGASIRQRSRLERLAAAADRDEAAADRRRAAADRHDAGIDDLTGLYRRATGELALAREIARARRSGRSLVLAMLDVDALKAVNDAHGHAAGDALLRDLPTAITAALRSYDVIVRWGGDEFACALSEVSLEVAAERLADIQRALGELRPGASISSGLAELTDGDTLESLVGRADADLYRSKAVRIA